MSMALTMIVPSALRRAAFVAQAHQGFDPDISMALPDWHKPVEERARRPAELAPRQVGTFAWAQGFYHLSQAIGDHPRL